MRGRSASSCARQNLVCFLDLSGHRHVCTSRQLLTLCGRADTVARLANATEVLRAERFFIMRSVRRRGVALKLDKGSLARRRVHATVDR